MTLLWLLWCMAWFGIGNCWVWKFRRYQERRLFAKRWTTDPNLGSKWNRVWD